MALSDFPRELSNPALSALEAAKITTLKKLSTYTEKEILALHGVGPASIPTLRAALKAQGLAFASAKSVAKTTKVHPDIKKYNRSQAKADREICELLSETITTHLKGAENKVWHGHPVWFLDDNPIVGYSKLKDSVRLLFWSGQSFKEKGLKPEGSFKAAEARYTSADQVVIKDLKGWLKKSRDIQWDYKNIVKRKGVLKKLK